MPHITVPPIQWTKVVFDAAMMFLGSRGSGKTTNCKICMRDMIAVVERNIVYCGNPDNLVEWGEILPASFVGLFDLNHLQMVLEWQKKMFYQVRKEWTDAGHQLRDFSCPMWLRLRITFEDVGFGDVYKSKELHELLSNARHFGVGLNIIAQYYSQVPKGLRANMDYMVLTALSTGIEEIYNNTLKDSLKFKAFCKTIRFFTKRKGDAVLFNLHSGSSDLSTMISFRESLHQSPFYQISPVQLAYHNQHAVSKEVKTWLTWRANGKKGPEPRLSQNMTDIERHLVSLSYVPPIFETNEITIEDRMGQHFMFSKGH
jgi:hypothetical protein